jgi:hypothetical protein
MAEFAAKKVLVLGEKSDLPPPMQQGESATREAKSVGHPGSSRPAGSSGSESGLLGEWKARQSAALVQP